MKTIGYILSLGLVLCLVACDKDYECGDDYDDCECLQAIEGLYATADAAPDDYTLTLWAAGEEKGGDDDDCDDRYGDCDDDDDDDCDDRYGNCGDDDDDDYDDDDDCALKLELKYQADESQVFLTSAMKAYLDDDCEELVLPQQEVDGIAWKGNFTLDDKKIVGTLYRDGVAVPLTLLHQEK